MVYIRERFKSFNRLQGRMSENKFYIERRHGVDNQRHHFPVTVIKGHIVYVGETPYLVVTEPEGFARTTPRVRAEYFQEVSEDAGPVGQFRPQGELDKLLELYSVEAEQELSEVLR